MTDFAAQRMKMVDSQLRTEDVTDYRVLAAMGAVPRERFVPERLRRFAYLDDDLLLSGSGEAPPRYLMRPAAFARLVQLAAIAESDRVLDVGCASGYSAAVVARLAREVIALESEPRLASLARSTLAELGVANATVVSGPLAGGHLGQGPYDAILLEGAVDVVPDDLLRQLGEGGRLVAVAGHGGAASVVMYTKSGREIGSRPGFNLSLRPLPGFERPKTFVF